jgi:hypothetical protein
MREWLQLTNYPISLDVGWHFLIGSNKNTVTSFDVATYWNKDHPCHHIIVSLAPKLLNNLVMA